tara:strand:+ start:146 stop:667 length:522 start_codon:yes stop_codon:yes gene_type:complete
MSLPNPQTEQSKKKIVVQEEHGYRNWAGTLSEDMTVESVIEWWKNLPTVMGMFFNPSKSFPMDLYELEDVADDDADVAIMQWVDSDGQEHILDRSDVVLFAHVHMDDDSYMKIPKGETFYHAGYGEMPFSDEEYDEEEDECDEPPTEAQIREWASESELSRKLYQALHPELKL